MRSSLPALFCIFAIIIALGSTGVDAQGRMTRLTGKCIDPEGNPLPGITITVTSPDMDSLEIVKTSNKKGKFTIGHPDSSFNYLYVFEGEGIITLELPMRVTAGTTEQKEFILLPKDQPQSQGSGGVVSEDQPVSKVVKVYNEGVEAQQLGNLELAAEKYREAAEIEPELAAPHTSLAALAIIQEDWETAAAEAEAAVALDPNDVRALQIRFDAYRRAGNEEKATEAADALRAVGDLSDAAKRLFNDAVDAYNAGNIAAAQPLFQQVVELDPTIVPAHTALARIALQQGSPAAAAESAKAATAQDPTDSESWMLLFDSSRLAGDLETAEYALQMVAQFNPAWIDTTLYEHATALYNEGAVEEAATELAMVVKARPNLPRAHYFYGMSLFNTGDTAKAKAELEKFIELAPEDPEAAVAREMLTYIK